MGIIFKNIEKPYFLFTNFKVMYSTLIKQPNLRKLTYQDFINEKDEVDKYFLARNPYFRLESFYRDKFVDYPSRCVFSENFEWQYCEKIFLTQYDINKEDFEETKNVLLNTSFEKFIQMLPSTYLFDGHLVPQMHAFYYFENKLPAKIKFTGLLKMEDEENMAFLKNNLHIDTSIRENATKGSKAKIVWDQASRKIVNALYYSDFEELGYDVINE